MSTVRANGVSLHVQRLEPAGRGPASDHAPTAVLIHGMAFDSLASWYFTLAKPLTEVGLRVVMYDLRGHGRSERPRTGYQLDDFVDDLDALLDELGVTGPVHLIGNSFGGTIAYGYALRHPGRVAAIATIESSPPTRVWFERVTRRLGRVAAYLPREESVAEIGVSRGEVAARRARLTRQMFATTTLAQDLPASRLPSPEEISAIDCPVLSVYGADSDVAQLAPMVQRLLPQTRTVVVPGQKHSVLIDQPQTMRQVVLSWLEDNRLIAPAAAVSVT